MQQTAFFVGCRRTRPAPVFAPGLQRLAQRGGLPPTEWTAAWTAGRALSAAQAVAEALEDATPSPSLDALPLLMGSGPL